MGDRELVKQFDFLGEYAPSATYYSKVNTNVFVSYGGNDRGVHNSYNFTYIQPGYNLSDYFDFLDPHPMYSNYRPIFVFYQD